MKIYSIEVPYLSRGLKRSYHKNLEVFEYEYNSDRNEAILIAEHKYIKNKWKRIEKSGTILRNVTVRNDIIQSTANSTYDPFFNDFDMAVISKLFLIDELKKTFEKHIAAIQESMRKNIPDVSNELKRLREKHAELFI